MIRFFPEISSSIGRGDEKCLELCCDEIVDCRRFEFLEPFDGDYPKKNLERIRKLGVQEGIRLRGKC